MFSFLHVLFLFSYVSSSGGSFPKKLTAEEEKKYLELYKNGSEEARNILIERNLRLVVHITKKYSNSATDTEDLISIGTIGLIKGITSFDSSKGTKLATYTAKCIENEILMSMRASKKYNGDLYLDDPIGQDKEGNSISMIDVISADNEPIEDEINLKMQIKKLYEKMKYLLRDREKLVLQLRYGLFNGDELTQREIAQMLGISRSYVSRIEKRALKKLEGEMKE